jgi:hypothetical protein
MVGSPRSAQPAAVEVRSEPQASGAYAVEVRSEPQASGANMEMHWNQPPTVI